MGEGVVAVGSYHPCPVCSLDRTFLHVLCVKRGRFPQVSQCSWDQPEHHFMCSLLRWSLRTRGQENIARSLSGPFSREGRWRLPVLRELWIWFHLNFSSSLGRKGVTWPERILNIASTRKGGWTLVLFAGSKQFSNKILLSSLFLKHHENLASRTI